MVKLSGLRRPSFYFRAFKFLSFITEVIEIGNGLSVQRIRRNHLEIILPYIVSVKNSTVVNI